MQQIITAKLKLLTTPEQGQSLRQTQLAYRDALNYASHYAFEHGKMRQGGWSVPAGATAGHVDRGTPGLTKEHARTTDDSGM